MLTRLVGSGGGRLSEPPALAGGRSIERQASRPTRRRRWFRQKQAGPPADAGGSDKSKQAHPLTQVVLTKKGRRLRPPASLELIGSGG